ncbi:hypothetical protein HZF24_01520 [Sedimentibacter hydroxybenzoicus DSM 7310]|uniref:Uncharacterized protein n=1 Tax=Sedimentibacter hydroxybenzoicus DSM 7310 TaxID=1123245 RepID=A0A974BGN0_SEDHY|nr:hypothetical protein [Sedimentibacter hydroxybenzoicus]NYB72814.1 hypothetical protein [Sedimentibacter hydroxybenzoicus DSM 7310]
MKQFEMFQMRRIKAVAEQLYEKKGGFKRWELVRISGIRKDYENKLNAFIDEIVVVYNC